MEKSQKPDVTAQAIDGNGKQVIAAAGLLCFVLGSVHAFSVFLTPLETMFSVSRANVSLIYSLSLISLTISVLLGPKFYSRLLPYLHMGHGVAIMLGRYDTIGQMLDGAHQRLGHVTSAERPEAAVLVGQLA